MVMRVADSIVVFIAQAGVGHATTVEPDDDTLGLYAARAWWSLRVYDFESARSSMAASPPASTSRVR